MVSSNTLCKKLLNVNHAVKEEHPYYTVQDEFPRAYSPISHPVNFFRLVFL